MKSGYLGVIMSIKKSLRFTFILFASLPLLLILCLFRFTFTDDREKDSKTQLLELTKINKNHIELLLKSPLESKSSDFLSKLNEHETQIMQFFTSIHSCNSQILSFEGVIYANNQNSTDVTSAYKRRISDLFLLHDKKSVEPAGSFSIKGPFKTHIYSYAFFDQTNIMLLQEKEIMIPFQWYDILCYVLLSLLIFLPCALIADHYYQKIYIKPILELRNVMKIASSGNLNVTSTLKATNELGDLSRGLNKMLHTIKGNYDELTIMHERLIENEDTLRNNYDRIEYLAYHDVLTGLPNRLAFVEYTNRILSESKVSKDHHAIYFIDLDNFKMINDTLGHDYGDLLLKQTASSLLSLLSEKDCIARAGGDEFMIIKTYISSCEEAIDFANQILHHFQMPMLLKEETAYISLSIGISMYPDNGLDTTTLTKNSDIAMYNSKENGKNKYTLFNHQMEDHLNHKNLITEVLRHAIYNSEVYLLYQPLVNIKENKVTAYEALLRIYNPRLGLLSPREFIPIAEETGLINELGTWALREACRFNKSLIDCGIDPCIVSVNISPVQINRFDFFDQLSMILEETQLPPQYLELELTESALVSSIPGTVTIIEKLHEIGVKVALDDFGTGYSSLNYLAKMNIHTLKIDKSFIDNICVSDKELSMVHTIIRLAHHLGIHVVAEGVEHSSQLVLLVEKKCDFVQGFVYSKPLLSNDLIRILKSSTTSIKR